MATKYTYHIDLDERGLFMAHVENSRGRVIASYDLPQWECNECGNSQKECVCEEDHKNYSENWGILDPDWGIMKHNQDVAGLERHYKEMGMMPQNAELVLVK